MMHSTDTSPLAQEIQSLPRQTLLLSRHKFDVYLATAKHLGAILPEIGRLREITFRAVGEGTGKDVDLDRYDQLYYNMFIWDREAERIAGGYRLGPGRELMKQYGREGFYLNSLFKIKKDFDPIFRCALELGRTFVVQDYQRDYHPLFLLWKGILLFLKQHRHYKYLIGPVSISKYYSHVSKDLIVAFIKRFCYDSALAKLVQARKPYRYQGDTMAIESQVASLNGAFNDLEQFLDNIEPDHLKLPVLLRQYSRQNAKFIGFNIDPNFSDALDGLMILDLADLPPETIALLQS